MKRILISLAVLGLAVFGCGKKSADQPAIARVNKAVLVQQDFIDILPEGMTNVTPAQKEEFVRRWVNTELFYQEAQKKGLDKEPKIAKQIRDLQKEILANQFIQKEIVEKLKVTDTEAREYFEAHQEEYQAEVKLSQILTATADQAQMVKASLDNGEDFAKLAREKSLDPTTKDKGGDLGIYLRRGSGQIPIDFEEKVFSLKKGGISEPIKLSDGYHIMKVTERRISPQGVKFEDIREDLVYGLTMLRQKTRFDNISDSLRLASKVESHPELIK
ncbi:MAG: peptidyl-prolyl cis-trans isomerase [Candidatus Edwardsbacteria bacterium]|nr:peptidyl-prolyl cis-trans isomerase [Candidatus Edwardsbacteria bacterium]MBU1576798.1 peptidyl-prolyl cis-trans isomerase [Candidatus Edwardsbacteria bacterium]MBU2463889.1 peptidyl-prolyl cis-trans isomerase [Candidatus Edwardsbacteria bacterium]MBU2593345.1 peptidyl-prolyl cis-trans isomerase [Candidatus Edwardsbacteria bacterium]